MENVAQPTWSGDALRADAARQLQRAKRSQAQVQVVDRFLDEAIRRGYIRNPLASSGRPVLLARPLLEELFEDPEFGPAFLDELSWALRSDEDGDEVA